jgi:hypothetical protein
MSVDTHTIEGIIKKSGQKFELFTETAAAAAVLRDPVSQGLYAELADIHSALQQLGEFALDLQRENLQHHGRLGG